MLALVWIVIVMICGRYTAVIWWDAIADFRWSEARELPQARLLTAQDQLMIHSVLMTIQVIAFGIGIVAFLVPVPDHAARIAVARFALIGGFITIELLLTTMSIWSRRNWQRILHLIERASERSPEPTIPRRESSR